MQKKEIKVDDFYQKTVGVTKTFHCTTNLIKKNLCKKSRISYIFRILYFE
jgi:hypothetical protein